MKCELWVCGFSTSRDRKGSIIVSPMSMAASKHVVEHWWWRQQRRGLCSMLRLLWRRPLQKEAVPYRRWSLSPCNSTGFLVPLEASRSDAVKKLWEHIKLHNLWAPNCMNSSQTLLIASSNTTYRLTSDELLLFWVHATSSTLFMRGWIILPLTLTL